MTYRCHAYIDLDAVSPEHAASRFASLWAPHHRPDVVYVAEPEPSPCASRLVRAFRRGERGLWEATT